MSPAPAPRIVRATAQTMELPEIQGKVLFPTLRQGPWLPVVRLAESTAQGPWEPDLHSHVSEEVVNYVLSGGIVEVDAADRRVELGVGTVVVHASGEEYRHDVAPRPGGASRWLSVVASLPRGRVPAAAPSGVFRAPAPTELAPGILSRALVGGGAEARSQLGMELSTLEFARHGSTRLAVPADRRAVLYAIGGQGSIGGLPTTEGEGVLTENATTLEAEGGSGFELFVVTVPSPSY